jgi:hypothetical protein
VTTDSNPARMDVAPPLCRAPRRAAPAPRLTAASAPRTPARRETHCDFCRQRLPDWKDVLTPDSDTTSAPAVMNVNFDNKTYSFTVGGSGGRGGAGAQGEQDSTQLHSRQRARNSRTRRLPSAAAAAP